MEQRVSTSAECRKYWSGQAVVTRDHAEAQSSSDRHNQTWPQSEREEVAEQTGKKSFSQTHNRHPKIGNITYRAAQKSASNMKMNMERPSQARKRAKASQMKNKVIPKVVCNSFIEEIQQEKFCVGPTALNYTGTRVSANTEQFGICCMFVIVVSARKCWQRVGTQAKRRTNDHNELGSKTLHCVHGQRRHAGCAVHEGQQVCCNIASEEDIEHDVCARGCATCEKKEDCLMGHGTGEEMKRSE